MNNIVYDSCYVIILSYIFIIGLCFGSFLNVLILRGLSGDKFVFDRSKCPKCGKQLKWYMNIPLISYIFLKGKCAFCNCHISLQYPVVEILCAISFLVSFLAFGLTLKAIFVCIFFFFFLALAVTDIKEKVIIDYHSYILAIFGLLYSILNLNDINWITSILGAIFGYLVIEIIALSGKFIANERTFGEGDSLIALALGSIFGVKNLLVLIPLAIIIQCFIALPILSYHSFKENKKALCFSYLSVAIGIVFIVLANVLKLDNYPLYYFILVLIISILLLRSLKNIILSIKEKKLSVDENYLQNYSFMPFGPALIISAILCIFFLNNIKDFIYNFIF